MRYTNFTIKKIFLKKEVKEFCKEHGLTVEQFYGREVYKGNLDLSDIKELPEGFNPTVFGFLFLSSLKKLPQGFNPTVVLDLF